MYGLLYIMFAITSCYYTSLLFYFIGSFFILFYFIFGCAGSSLLRARLSLVAASRGYSSLPCTGFSLKWLLLLRSSGSRCVGFSSCGSRALERRLSSWQRTGLAALRHVGSSRTRARTHVPHIGRRILNHCTTREVREL